MYVRNNSELESISRSSNISIDKIKLANPKYVTGKKAWVFIPMGPGVLESYDNFTFSYDLYGSSLPLKLSVQNGEDGGKTKEGMISRRKEAVILWQKKVKWETHKSYET